MPEENDRNYIMSVVDEQRRAVGQTRIAIMDLEGDQAGRTGSQTVAGQHKLPTLRVHGQFLICLIGVPSAESCA